MGGERFRIVGERGAYGVQRLGRTVFGWHRIRVDAEMQMDRHEETWKAALNAVLVAHANIFVRESAESRRMKRALEELKAEAAG